MPTRKDFLSAIRMEFDTIHKTIAKIKAIEKVPLPDYPKADPVDFTFLLQLERDARDSFPVSIDGKIADVNVRELLNGIRPSKSQAAKVFISYGHDDKKFVQNWLVIWERRILNLGGISTPSKAVTIGKRKSSRVSNAVISLSLC